MNTQLGSPCRECKLSSVCIHMVDKPRELTFVIPDIIKFKSECHRKCIPGNITVTGTYCGNYTREAKFDYKLRCQKCVNKDICRLNGHISNKINDELEVINTCSELVQYKVSCECFIVDKGTQDD